MIPLGIRFYLWEGVLTFALLWVETLWKTKQKKLLSRRAAEEQSFGQLVYKSDSFVGMFVNIRQSLSQRGKYPFINGIWNPLELS